MTMLYDWAEGLADLEIDGVEHDFGLDRPQSLKGTQLPAKWLQSVGVNRERMALNVLGDTAHGVGTEMRATMVIAIRAVDSGLPEDNFKATLEMSDVVTLAVTKADVALSWPNVSTEVTQIPLQGGQEYYWAVVAMITATG